MKIVSFLLSAVVTIALVTLLNMQLPSGKTKTPRLGYFLSPQYGFWQNAEPTNAGFDEDISIPGFKATTEVYFDDRLVPHIYAENDEDAYLAQGFIHAKFRLWQMEFQTYIAGGRLSEITGESSLPTDRYLRRLGLLYGAEQALKMIEANPVSKASLDAYTAGVNAYIKQLKPQDIPFEYKLMDYKPEPWSNLKTALFLKLMSFDLTNGGNGDFLRTNAKNFFGIETYNKLYPAVADSLDPIVPKGTVFEKPSVAPIIPASYDSAYIGKTDSFTVVPPIQTNPSNGSNNWAVGGSKTKSGRPILCNDPHLGLNLPSLWYEVQITTPTHSTYGASFPGSPAVIIGFNDSIAWGVTNAGRDVMDFYKLKFKDTTLQEYWYNGNWKKADARKEVFKIKGQAEKTESIAITAFGPVMYDHTYPAINGTKETFAVKWTAHDPSNDWLTFYYLNRAKNYVDYATAISNFKCPGQNVVFASKTGDIAIRQQGNFINKWKNQGLYIMPGEDSSYQWQQYIPEKEHAQMLNPARGFVSSANQMAVDNTYPYYLGAPNNFPIYRGIIINKMLTNMSGITAQDMQALQTNNDNAFTNTAKPLLLKYIAKKNISEAEKKYCKLLTEWNNNYSIESKAASVFEIWWDSTEALVFNDEFAISKNKCQWPPEHALVEAMLKDSNYLFVDDVATTNYKETFADIVHKSLQKIIPVCDSLDKANALGWSVFKDTRVSHFTKIDALSKLHITCGGNGKSINAIKDNHGPSWRMIVHLTDNIEAYGVYPGGQSGNPGSKYYDSFIDYWAAGKYYQLLFVKKQEARHSNRIKWHITFVANVKT